jgi:prophage DNA circulation protein
MSVWTQALRSGSYAGVPFYWRSLRAQAGRRLIEHQLPLAPVDLEDLGPLPEKFTLTMYFIGNAWLFEREAMLSVLAKANGAATLVLPTKGPKRVRVGSYSYNDNADLGAYGAIDVDFVVDHGAPGPFSSASAAGTILNAINAVQQSLINAYMIMAGPITSIEAASSYAQALLTSAASAFLSLPNAIISTVQANFAASPTNLNGTASTVSNAFLAASNQLVTNLAIPLTPITPITGITPAPRFPADPSFGVAALAQWSATPAPAPYAPSYLAQTQQAIGLLIDQSASLALVNAYAQLDFPSSNAAIAARDQLATALEAVAESLYDAGQVDLYRAWCALQSQAIADMIARAQNLPSLATYSEITSLPDVVLAQKFYQDGTQGDALALLNDAIHPLFMPITGQWLRAAS